MACYKIVLVVVAFLAATSNGASIVPRLSDAHNVDECYTTTPLTTPLLLSNIYEPGKFLQVVKRTITFTEPPTNLQPIMCIRVTNMDTSNHGGYPVLVKGGVGAYDAEILITSQLGQPLNFRIEIYAE